MTEPTLLCVDDERSILHALKRLFRKEPYRFLIAQNGQEALSVLDEEEVQVIISDYRMPDMTGTALLREVKQRFPETVRVVLSGYADVDVIMESINEGEIYRYLSKPWNDEELRVTIHQCFDRFRLMQENARLVEQVRVQNESLKELNEDLERTVEARTRSLRLSQEILEKLPIPVVGISSDGMIVLVNAAMSRLLPSAYRMPLGLMMSAVLSADIIDLAEACLIGEESHSKNICTLFGQDYCLHVTVLRDGGHTRGCIVALENVRHVEFSLSTNSKTY